MEPGDGFGRNAGARDDWDAAHLAATPDHLPDFLGLAFAEALDGCFEFGGHRGHVDDRWFGLLPDGASSGQSLVPGEEKAVANHVEAADRSLAGLIRRKQTRNFLELGQRNSGFSQPGNRRQGDNVGSGIDAARGSPSVRVGPRWMEEPRPVPPLEPGHGETGDAGHVLDVQHGDGDGLDVSR